EPTERSQERPIRPGQAHASRLAPKNRQLVPQHQDLEILRSARARRHHHQTERSPTREIHQRPKHPTPPSTDSATEPNLPATPAQIGANEFLNPTRSPSNEEQQVANVDNNRMPRGSRTRSPGQQF